MGAGRAGRTAASEGEQQCFAVSSAGRRSAKRCVAAPFGRWGRRPLLDIWTLYRHLLILAMTHRDDFPGLVRVRADAVGYTCKLKVYPSGSVAVTVSDLPIFRPEGWEAVQSVGAGTAPVLMGGDSVGPDRAVWEAAQRKAADNLARSPEAGSDCRARLRIIQ